MDEYTPRRHFRLRRRHRLAGSLLSLGLLVAAAYWRQLPIPAAAPVASPTAVTASQPGAWHVTRDVDGDTIDVSQDGHTETVRLLGVDTPETHDPRKPVQCFGQIAAAHTKSLVEGQDVRLSPDPTDSDRDKYNRLLRYVYLPNGTLLNAELIQDGYGFAYTVFPIEKLDQFRALEADARAHNRGLWAGCDVDSSQKIEQTTSTK